MFFVLLLLILSSCVSVTDKQLEATLTFAGTNRAELEKVLHHYKDNPQKQEAAPLPAYSHEGPSPLS